MWLISLFFSYINRQKLICLINKIRSSWLKCQFKYLGNQSVIGKIGRLHGLKYISIGKNTTIQEFIFLTAWETSEDGHTKNYPELTIGSNCNLGAFCHITCSNCITIGNNCLIGKNVTITDNSHGEISAEGVTLPRLKERSFLRGL